MRIVNKDTVGTFLLEVKTTWLRLILDLILYLAYKLKNLIYCIGCQILIYTFTT